jgi:hypothetical protein
MPAGGTLIAVLSILALSPSRRFVLIGQLTTPTLQLLAVVGGATCCAILILVLVHRLTHQERPAIDFANGTRFEFLAATPEDALARALKHADGGDIRVGGGASVARDFLRAGLVDRVHVAITPIVLGRGVRLWDDLQALDRDYTVTSELVESGVIHVTFAR